MRRLISQDEAYGRSSDPEELRNIMASGGGVVQQAPQRPGGGAGPR
jgi:twitching motility protein PilT